MGEAATNVCAAEFTACMTSQLVSWEECSWETVSMYMRKEPVVLTHIGIDIALGISADGPEDLLGVDVSHGRRRDRVDIRI